MGTWGVKLLENDAALDVYSIFEEQYCERKELESIKASVLKSFRLVDGKNSPVLEGNSNAWLAFALICWECQTLDEQTTEVVDQLLKQEIDSDDWEDLWDKRKKSIVRFQKKIAVPAKKIKKIPKYFKLVVPFDMGDCIVFKYEDGMYGGTICTAHITENKKPGYDTRHFANITYHAETKPTMEDFYASFFLMYRYAEDNLPYYTKLEESMIYVFTGRIDELEEYQRFKSEIAALEVIGQLKMKKPIQSSAGNMSFRLSSRYDELLAEEEGPEFKNRDFPVKNYCDSIE